MIILKSPTPNNPFREGVIAEADLDHEHQAAIDTYQPTSDGKNSPPTYAPPAYTTGDQLSVGTSSRGRELGATPLESLGPSSSVFAPAQRDSAFSRQAPQQPYPTFEPTFLIAVGQFLTRGFPNLPPPSTTVPHPFASHDVTESDWSRFLQEVRAAGKLTEKQESLAHLPIVSIIPIVGTLSNHIIRQQMKKGRGKDVGNVIDVWNHHFFHPRHMEVVLMRGATRLSGLDKHPGSPQGDTPVWPSNTSTPPTVESNGGKAKGKAKDEEDITYRLFIIPLSSHI